MKKIVNYKAVSASYATDLTTKVEAEIKLGWQPLGGMTGKQSDFAQALVKYEVVPEKKKICHSYTE